MKDLINKPLKDFNLNYVFMKSKINGVYFFSDGTDLVTSQDGDLFSHTNFDSKSLFGDRNTNIKNIFLLNNRFFITSDKGIFCYSDDFIKWEKIVIPHLETYMESIFYIHYHLGKYFFGCSNNKLIFSEDLQNFDIIEKEKFQHKGDIVFLESRNDRIYFELSSGMNGLTEDFANPEKIYPIEDFDIYLENGYIRVGNIKSFGLSQEQEIKIRKEDFPFTDFNDKIIYDDTDYYTIAIRNKSGNRYSDWKEKDFFSNHIYLNPEKSKYFSVNNYIIGASDNRIFYINPKNKNASFIKALDGDVISVFDGKQCVVIETTNSIYKSNIELTDIIKIDYFYSGLFYSSETETYYGTKDGKNYSSKSLLSWEENSEIENRIDNSLSKNDFDDRYYSINKPFEFGDYKYCCYNDGYIVFDLVKKGSYTLLKGSKKSSFSCGVDLSNIPNDRNKQPLATFNDNIFIPTGDGLLYSTFGITGLNNKLDIKTKSICYGNGKLICFNDNGDLVLINNDLTTKTYRNKNKYDINSIIFVKDEFFAVGKLNNKNILLKSNDGIYWDIALEDDKLDTFVNISCVDNNIFIEDADKNIMLFPSKKEISEENKLLSITFQLINSNTGKKVKKVVSYLDYPINFEEEITELKVTAFQASIHGSKLCLNGEKITLPYTIEETENLEFSLTN